MFSHLKIKPYITIPFWAQAMIIIIIVSSGHLHVDNVWGSERCNVSGNFNDPSEM